MPLTLFVAVSTIVLWLMWCISLPLMVWMTSKIYKKRHSVLLQKRAIGTAIFSCSLCIAWVLFGLPLSAIYPLLPPHSQLILGVTISILTPILTYGILFTICVRFFMVYFYYNWSAITLSTHWIFHIRKSSKKEHKARARKIRQIQDLQKQHNDLQLQLQQEQQRQVQKQQRQQIQQKEEVNTKQQKNATENKEQSVNEEEENEIGNNQSPHHLSPNIKQVQWVIQQHPLPEDIDFIHRHYQRNEAIRNSWFILNRFKYASTRKVLRKVFNVYTVAISVVIFVSVLAAYGDEGWIIAQFSVNWLLFLLPSIGITYFFHKTPKNIDDLFFVRQEMKSLAIVLMIIWISYFCVFFIYVFADNVPVNYMYALILTFQCVAFVYFQTEWTLSHLYKQQKALNCDFFNTNIEHEPNPFLTLDRSSYNSTLSSSPPFTNEMPIITEAQEEKVDVEEKKEETINCEEKPRSPGSSAIRDIIINMDSADYESEKFRILFNCLKGDKLFDDFTRYLCIEMSMELSFAFIELTQFRRLLERDAIFMRNVSKPQSSPHPFGYQNVQLPETISRSTIVHNKKYAKLAPRLRYRKIAKKLAEKYLDPGAEFEININDQTKQQVVVWTRNHCKDIRVPRSKKKSHSSRHSSNRSSRNSRSHRSTNASTNASTNVYSSQSERSRNCSSSKTLLSDQTYYLFEQCRKEIYFLMSHACHRFVQCRIAQARIDSLNKENIQNNDENDKN